jgi:hypothetical protein
VTGNPRDSVEGAGWETLFVAVDDHARIALGLSVILWARHTMGGKGYGYATQETNGSGTGCADGPAAGDAG